MLTDTVEGVREMEYVKNFCWQVMVALGAFWMSAYWIAQMGGPDGSNANDPVHAAGILMVAGAGGLLILRSAYVALRGPKVAAKPKLA